MCEKWKIVTNDDQISLHDCEVSSKYFDGDIIFHFETGFNVLESHSYNDTGRHKSTSESSVIFKNGVFKSFITLGGTETTDNGTKEVEPTTLTLEDFINCNLEVLSFEIELKTNTIAIEVLFDNIISTVENTSSLAVLELYSTEILFCWNEFISDAWFQDWKNEI